jgi:hypothetical protein
MSENFVDDVKHIVAMTDNHDFRNNLANNIKPSFVMVRFKTNILKENIISPFVANGRNIPIRSTKGTTTRDLFKMNSNGILDNTTRIKINKKNNAKCSNLTDVTMKTIKVKKHTILIRGSNFCNTPFNL